MKVLLIGDVGRLSDGFYHAGDEAMFYETYRWYSINYPNAVLNVLSKSISHNNLKISEHIHLSFPIKNSSSRIYFLKLSIKTIIKHLLKIDFFKNDEAGFNNLIESSDIIHFYGGGNIYSIYVPWLYYVFTIIFMSFINHKPVYLTSQSIGPIDGIDRIFAFFIMNLVKVIAVREPAKNKSLGRLGIFKPKIYSMVDIAYGLPKTTRYKLATKKILRIGLSLHQWKNYEDNMERIMVKLLTKLNKSYEFEIVVIPHILVTKMDNWDYQFNKKIVSKFPRHIKINIPTYKELTGNSIEPAMTIKYLTANMDMLITSRYHGIIFALSENVPCLALSMDKYHQNKNNNAMKFWYGDKYKNYIIELKQDNVIKDLTEKTISILNNMKSEKAQLIHVNNNLNSNQKITKLDQLIDVKSLNF